MDYLVNGIGIIDSALLKNIKLDHCFRVHTKINPTWSKDLNDKDKMVKLVEHIGEYSTKQEHGHEGKNCWTPCIQDEHFCSHY